MEKFRIVLEHWRKDVERAGGNFHMAILSREVARELTKPLLQEKLSSYNILYLPRAEEVEPLNTYSTEFENDDHWNEIGNLASVETFIKYFSHISGEPNPNEIQSFMVMKRDEILDYYSQYESSPPRAR